MAVFVCVCFFFCVCACASRTGVLELLRVHAVSPADSEMDVRFFPAPPSSVGSCTLPADSGLDYYHPNKVTVLSTFFFACLFACSLFYLSPLPLRQAARATHTQTASVGRRQRDHQVHFPAHLGWNPGPRTLLCLARPRLRTNTCHERAHAIIPFSRAECGWGRRRKGKAVVSTAAALRAELGASAALLTRAATLN